MAEARELEIRQNYSFFKEIVASLMDQHAGQFALIRNRTIVEYYNSAGSAVADGARRFGDLPFSVQRVIDRPIDLGFLSHATDNGITVSG
jgi:hypothetical protein